MTKMRPKVFKEDRKQRHGRGFSRGELRKAGLSVSEAVKLGILVDARRKTAHEENVKAATTFLEEKAALKPKKPKGKSKSQIRP